MSYQKPVFKEQYENFIGGKWVAPVDGNYFEDTSPIDGGFIAKVPRSNSKDIDLAVQTYYLLVYVEFFSGTRRFAFRNSWKENGNTSLIINLPPRVVAISLLSIFALLPVTKSR